MRTKATRRSVVFFAKFLDPSGVSAVMLAQAAALVEHGWRVTLLHGGMFKQHQFSPTAFQAVGAECVEVPLLRLDFSSLVLAPQSLRILHNVFQTAQPEIVHVHYRSVSLLAAIIARMQQLPLVSTLHTNHLPTAWGKRWLSCWGERAICLSAAQVGFLTSAFGYPLQRVQLLPNGVDVRHFRPPSSAERDKARRKFSVLDDSLVVSFVGRIMPKKGQATALRALARLVHASPRTAVQLLIAGRGADPHVQLLREEIADLNLSRSEQLLGHINDPREVFWASDVNVLTSYVEGFAMVTLEAMACAVVPIRTPSEGASAVVLEGQTGFIVDFDDDQALADRLQRLANDPLLLQSMRQSAHEFVRTSYTLDEVTERLIGVYEEVISER